MMIRDEKAGDAAAIRPLITEAFKAVPYSRGTEAAIYDALWAANVATIALVAEDDGEVVGQIILSPVAVGAVAEGWLGAGPVAVRPDRQGRGLGRALVEAALERARKAGFKGCVLVGDPGFYSRFGFAAHPGLIHEGVPDEFVLGLSFGGAVPKGACHFHPAFLAE